MSVPHSDYMYCQCRRCSVFGAIKMILGFLFIVGFLIALSAGMPISENTDCEAIGPPACATEETP